MIETLHFDDEQEAWFILDQTLLPNEIKYLLSPARSVFEAIQQLRVRGAPAIVLRQAYGIYWVCYTAQRSNLATFIVISRLRKHFCFCTSNGCQLELGSQRV